MSDVDIDGSAIGSPKSYRNCIYCDSCRFIIEIDETFMRRYGHHSIFDLHNEYHSLTATIYNNINKLLNIEEKKRFTGINVFKALIGLEAIENFAEYTKKINIDLELSIELIF